MIDDAPLPVSALQHWVYCPRQCGLILLEQVFDDNVNTLRDQAVHATADKPGVEIRKGLCVERALPLYSDRLGLFGKAAQGPDDRTRDRRDRCASPGSRDLRSFFLLRQAVAAVESPATIVAGAD